VNLGTGEHFLKNTEIPKKKNKAKPKDKNTYKRERNGNKKTFSLHKDI
jgi:hypothetical protein